MRLRVGFVLLLLATQFSFSQRSGHQLSGYVREENTTAGVQSVALEVLASGQRATPPVVSGMEGEFRFGGLRDGDYYITATKKGYEPVTIQVSIMAGSAPPVMIYLRKEKSAAPAGPGEAVSARQLAIPQKARELFEKGRQLIYEKSEPKKAIEQFKLAIELFPDYFEAYTQIGVAYYRLSKFSDAERALKKAVEISAEKYPDALFLLAAMFNDQERFGDAEEPARLALAAGDSTWRGPYELARALVGLKRAPEAEASAVQARDLKPDNAQVYLVLANAHIQQQKFPSVVEDFDEYLKLAPNALGSDQIRQRRDRMREILKRASAQQAPTSKQ